MNAHADVHVAAALDLNWGMLGAEHPQLSQPTHTPTWSPARPGACAARVFDWVVDLHCCQHDLRSDGLACQVLLKIVYLLTCRVLGLAVLAFRDDRAKEAELLVLRHENAVLRLHGIGLLRGLAVLPGWFVLPTSLQ